MRNFIPRFFLLLIIILYCVSANSGSPLDNLKSDIPPTKIQAHRTTPWEKYHIGEKSRLVILLTNPKSSWLDLAHGLKTMGIPFSITTNLSEALSHSVVMIYPLTANTKIANEMVAACKAFVELGGTLIGVGLASNELNKIFGFDKVISPQPHARIKFLNNKSFDFNFFTDPREQEITIGSNHDVEASMQGASYTHTESTPLATYEDKTAAIVEKKFPNHGRAIAIGLDLGDYFYRGHTVQAALFSRGDKENFFEPSIDVILRWIKKIYQESQPNAVTLGTVPYDRDLSVLITHDICFNPNTPTILKYASYEHSKKIPATYFFQTKYIKDYFDVAFFNLTAINVLNQLQNKGMEVGSHSVAHGQEFDRFPMGTGNEQFQKYHPYNVDQIVTNGASVLGELRISKFLLERFGKQKTLSFRAGFLKNSHLLPQALAATDYLYDSSEWAHIALSHFPFQRNYSDGTDDELNIFEFPVTMDEGEIPFAFRNLPLNIPKMLSLAKKIANERGVFVLLIHPTLLPMQKLEAEKQFYFSLKNSAWFGTMREFGAWWAARNRVEIDVKSNQNKRIVFIEAPIAISGLTLQIPGNWKLESTYPANIMLAMKENRIVLKSIRDRVKLIFND